MATIYLSSTYEDLKDYRTAVYEALRKSGHDVKAMEDYVAADQRPVDKCLKDVERADIYVGLFAFRYGYIPPSQHNNANGLSITELEYRRAESLKRPCLTFVVNDATAWPRVFDDAYAAEDKGQRIKALRQHLLAEKLASPFSDPHKLSALVLAAVTKHLDENKQSEPGREQAQGGSTSITWDIVKLGSPYPGLLHFTRKYAPVFFGRDREVREILDRLREPGGRFLLISGASGSGKSSLVDAGVLPRIEHDGIAGERKYRCVRMVPGKADHPFDALLRPLHSYAERAGMDAYQLAEELVREPGNLSQRIQEIVAKGLDSDGLVLFLDQMEELFTIRDPAQSQAFLSALFQAVQDASLHVIATIRSDFLPYCHEQADLLRVLNGRGYIGLGPIDGISISEMISKPAHCAGLMISERLVRRLVEEAGQGRGSLPLLAFALQQLFEKRERASNELTEKAFEQLGGLVGAIRSHATTVEDKFVKSLGTENREIFSKLFASLVMVTIDRTPTRRWASKEKFDAPLRAGIDILIKERLLTADEGKDHESLISVAHERLFEGWPGLAAWIETNREHLFILRQAEIEAGEWERHGYDLDYLWSPERLKKLQGILEGLGHEQVNAAVQLYAAPQDKLIERLQRNALSHTERLKIGQYLAALGDPRHGAGVKDGVPDIAWVDIPGGQVKLEKITSEFEVKPFRIAKYPVTNAQFDAFLKVQGGYDNGEWWEDIEQSHGREQSKWQEANCPRENVSWYEAVAFCRWLSAKTGTNIRLPTEWEWQQAATGGDPQREYPWEGGWEGSRSNSFESRLDRTTAVGMYPLGATHHGLLDMVGNVWEWCLNTDEKPDQPEAVTINKTGGRRGIRGGSWNFRPGNLRTSDRYWFYADNRGGNIGFRLAQDLEP